MEKELNFTYSVQEGLEVLKTQNPLINSIEKVLILSCQSKLQLSLRLDIYSAILSLDRIFQVDSESMYKSNKMRLSIKNKESRINSEPYAMIEHQEIYPYVVQNIDLNIKEFRFYIDDYDPNKIVLDEMLVVHENTDYFIHAVRRGQIIITEKNLNSFINPQQKPTVEVLKGIITNAERKSLTPLIQGMKEINNDDTPLGESDLLGELKKQLNKNYGNALPFAKTINTWLETNGKYCLSEKTMRKYLKKI